MDLISAITEEASKTIPDIAEDKSVALAEHLTSSSIGVRSLESLYDVELEVIASVLPRVDAKKLHRTWQLKYRPEHIQRRHLVLAPGPSYAVKWQKIPEGTLNQLKRGKWLAKKRRCEMLRLVVDDVIQEMPDVKRRFFNSVAASMVREYPAALQDRGENTKPLHCTYYSKKLKTTFDEVRRALTKKVQEEAPNIPEAYGCVRWRVHHFPQNETQETMLAKKKQLIDMSNNQRRQDWDWTQIEELMTVTFKLQREDINSQVMQKKRRAPGAPQQPRIYEPKSTQQLVQEWPFLFLAKGIVVHFKILTGKDFIESLKKFEKTVDPDKFLEFLVNYKDDNKSIMKRYKKAVRRGTCKDPHVIAICLMLLKAFKENEGLFLKEIESTTPIDEVKNVIDIPPTPFIVSLGPIFEARKFYFCIDSEPVSSVRPFWAALSVAFQSYYVMNLKYPKELGNTLEFYQRTVVGINPEKGTRTKKTSYRSNKMEKYETLMSEYEVWIQERESEEEEEEVDHVI